MTEKKFDNLFHKRYVGEKEGGVAERPVLGLVVEIQPQTLEEIRRHYRKYVGDPQAELPEEVLNQLTKRSKN